MELEPDDTQPATLGDIADLVRSLHPRPTPIELFNQVADSYDSIYTGPAIEAENRLVWRLVERMTIQQGRVLDWGCGTGWLLEGCPFLESEYLGIDPAEGMLRIARKKFPAHQFKTRLDEEDREQGFAAVVSVWGPLSYDQRAEQTAQDLISLVRSGGQVLFTVYGPRHDSRGTPAVELDPQMHRTFTAAEAMRLVAGLERVRVWGLGWGEPNPSLSPRMLDWLLRIERWTLGRWYPDDCYAIVVQGRKP